MAKVTKKKIPSENQPQPKLLALREVTHDANNKSRELVYESVKASSVKLTNLTEEDILRLNSP